MQTVMREVETLKEKVLKITYDKIG
jgi:hypothetical protein